MSLKESLLQRSCSTVLTAGKGPRNSSIDNVTNLPQRSASCSRKPNAINESKPPLLGSSRNIPNESTSLILSPRSKCTHKEKPAENPIRSCYCLDCATEKDVPKKYIEELESQLQSLTQKLHEEKNNNQLLRRNLLMAKRVLVKEVGDEGGDLDNLLKKATDESWKGRQELILSLKRELRDLNETIERIEKDPKVPSSRKMCRQKKEKSQEVIPDERKIYWCLELERQEVFKNAQRYKKGIIDSRDSMKEALRLLVIRNDELAKEISNLRTNLSALPVNVDKGLVDRLHEVESKIEIALERKVDSRRVLDDLDQQNCRNSKAIVQVKENIISEKKNEKDQEKMLNSLKIHENNLRLMFEDVNKEKCKQAIVMKKQLDDVEKDYSKIVLRLDKTLTSITDSKELLKKLKTMWKKNKFENNSDIWNCCMLPDMEAENGVTYGELPSGNSSELSVEIDSNGLIFLYQNELLEYQAALDFLEHRNIEKFKKLYNTSRKTKEEASSLLKNRYVLEKLKLDTKVLKNRIKKFRKVVNHPSQQKLVKKKISSQQLTETLDVGRMQLNILKTESKFLKVLIKRTFSSKEDDFELLNVYLERNRDLILKHLPSNII